MAVLFLFMFLLFDNLYILFMYYGKFFGSVTDSRIPFFYLINSCICVVVGVNSLPLCSFYTSFNSTAFFLHSSKWKAIETIGLSLAHVLPCYNLNSYPSETTVESMFCSRCCNLYGANKCSEFIIQECFVAVLNFCSGHQPRLANSALTNRIQLE
jgi:hypothetical protein